MKHNIELLAPAGDIEIAKVAINCGANAIYVGGKMFSARSYSPNFSDDELVEIIKYAHLRNAKVYIAINTTIFDDEIEECIDFLDFLYYADIDGVIISDLGLASLIKHRYKDLPLHASTQMSVVSIQQAEALKQLGFKRIVLARELTLQEITEIKKNVDIELEVFVHGALCVCYSGNCLLSSFQGGRSGNRGKCAQPCRLLYRLNDEEEQYYLSPKDLCTIDNVKQLQDIGIDSLKIEGRMRRLEYVAQTTAAYYDALYKNEKADFNLLQIAFNRGFTKGFIFNEDNDQFTNTKTSNHQGLCVGKVIKQVDDKVLVATTYPLHFGDSVRLVEDNNDTIIDVITINQMESNDGKSIKEALAKTNVFLKAHNKNLVNSKVYLTSSKLQHDTLLDYATKNDLALHTIPVTAKVRVKDEYLYLQLEANGKKAIVKSKEKVQASNNDLTKRLFEQIAKTNNPLLKVTKFEGTIDGFYLPIKDINEMRRTCVALLEEKLTTVYERNDDVNADSLLVKQQEVKDSKSFQVIVSTEEQLQTALSYDVDVFIASYSLYCKYKEQYPNIKYHFPRVSKKIVTDEGFMTNQAIFTSSAHLGTYSNVTNALTVLAYLQLGFTSVGLSLEMTYQDIVKLVKNCQKIIGYLPDLSMMVYGRIQLMIMKHCLLRKHFKTKMHCNKCINEHFFLQNNDGKKFRIFKDEECKSILLSDEVLSLYDEFDKIKQLGIKYLVLYFSTENSEETKRILEMYINNEKGIIENATTGHFLDGKRI